MDFYAKICFDFIDGAVSHLAAWGWVWDLQISFRLLASNQKSKQIETNFIFFMLNLFWINRWCCPSMVSPIIFCALHASVLYSTEARKADIVYNY